MEFATRTSATSARFKMSEDGSESEDEHGEIMRDHVTGDKRLAKIANNGKLDTLRPPGRSPNVRELNITREQAY